MVEVVPMKRGRLGMKGKMNTQSAESSSDNEVRLEQGDINNNIYRS